MALAMTYGGASGETETAMRETLGFSLGEETHPAFGKLQAALDTRATIDVPGSSNLAIHPTADKSEKKSLQFMTSGMMVTHQSFAKLLVNLEVVDSRWTTRA